MTIELDTTLAQAEVLFLSFSQLVADIDRRRAEGDMPTVDDAQRLRNRKAHSPGSGSTEQEEHRNESGTSTARRGTIALPTISSNLRELLESD